MFSCLIFPGNEMFAIVLDHYFSYCCFWQFMCGIHNCTIEHPVFSSIDLSKYWHSYSRSCQLYYEAWTLVEGVNLSIKLHVQPLVYCRENRTVSKNAKVGHPWFVLLLSHFTIFQLMGVSNWMTLTFSLNVVLDSSSKLTAQKCCQSWQPTPSLQIKLILHLNIRRKKNCIVYYSANKPFSFSSSTTTIFNLEY